MAAPYINLSLVALNTGTFDITAATGGANGFTGADWSHFKGYGSDKLDGGLGLQEHVLGSVTDFGLDWGGHVITFTDRENPENFGEIMAGSQSDSKGRVWPAGVSGPGHCVFINPPADQMARTVIWQMLKTSDTLKLTATLSDGSYGPVTIDLPGGGPNSFTDGNCSIKCDYRAVAPNSTLELRIWKPAVTGSYVTLSTRYRYSLVPTKPPRPRVASHG